ncbi:MAG: hypothetical protein IPJ78_17260 [Gemmatimonadetes bacterium]|nr:hypothetical protein [Gemmatimonadota bacterium]
MSRSPIIRYANDWLHSRTALLGYAGAFAAEARALSGVVRIALLGSILTEKPDPKDIDLLVIVSESCDLERLAMMARRVKGRAQSLGRGADVFLGAENGTYLGRACSWRDCRPGVRKACDANHCGRRPFLHDDLQTITLPTELVREPPLELFPHVLARRALPADVAKWLAELAGSAT